MGVSSVKRLKDILMTSTLGTLFFSGCSLDKLLLEVGIQITRMGIVEANDSELKRKQDGGDQYIDII